MADRYASVDPRAQNHAGQAGQVIPLVAGVVCLVAALGLGLATVGDRVVDRARAANAADAAALAAALEVDGTLATDRARTFAEHNGAELVECTRVGVVTVVRVRVDDAVVAAAARPARRRPVEPVPPEVGRGDGAG